MTLETLPELRTPLTQEQEPQDDAPTEAPAGTEEAGAPLDVDAAFGDFLKEKGHDGPTEAGEAQDGDAKVLTPEEAEARGREQAEARYKAEQQEGLRRQATVGYRNAIAEIDRLTQSLDEQTAARVRTLVNQMHSQSAAAHTMGWLDGLHGALAEALPEADRRTFMSRRAEDKSYGDLIKDFSASVRKGYVSETDVSKREKAAYAKGATETKAFFQDKGIIPGSKAPAAENGLAATGERFTLSQIESMPSTKWLAIGSADADGGRARRQKILDDARTRRN